MRCCSHLFALLCVGHLGQADLCGCASMPAICCVCCVVELRMSDVSLRISSSVVSRFELRVGIAWLQLPARVLPTSLGHCAVQERLSLLAHLPCRLREVSRAQFLRYLDT